MTIKASVPHKDYRIEYVSSLPQLWVFVVRDPEGYAVHDLVDRHWRPDEGVSACKSWIEQEIVRRSSLS
jgi:hypothetical protein